MSSVRSLVAVALVLAITATPLTHASTRLKPRTAQSQDAARGEGGGSTSCAGLRVRPSFIDLAWQSARVPLSIDTGDNMYCSWTVVPDELTDDWVKVSGSAQGMGSATVYLDVSEFRGSGGIFHDECDRRVGVIAIVSGDDQNTQFVQIAQYPTANPFCVIQELIDFFLDDCATEVAAAKVSNGGTSVKLARRYRDEVLGRTPRGSRYARQYYEFTAEASRVMSANPRLAFQAARLLQRYTPMLAAAVDGREVAMPAYAAREIDGFLGELGARSTSPMKAALADLRGDLRDPEAASDLGFTVLPQQPGEQAGSDELSIAMIDPATVLAAAARGRTYALGGGTQLDEIASLLTKHPLAALQLAGHMGRYRAIVHEIVDRGAAEITAEDVGVVDELLAAIQPDASPALSTMLRAARRDLHNERALGDYGIVLKGAPVASVSPVNGSTRTLGSGLGFSTFLGGAKSEIGVSIAIDSQGNLYIAGKTDATDFPVSGAVQSAFGGGPSDAFVAKLNSVGQVVYATYLGGSREDFATGIAVDAAGDAYVVGTTNSTNFPTVGPLQGSLRGTYNGFLAKLDASGAALAYSTYLGGSGFDIATGVAVDAGGNSYVTGAATSTNLSRPGGFGVINRGYTDAFVAKVNPTGSAFVYSTYVGGSGFDEAADIVVDAAGNATITGMTSSADLPTRTPAQGAFGGILDAFVTRLDPNGSTLVYSTYLGGAEPDGASGIALGADGSVVVSGSTASADFPLASPEQAAYGGGMLDAFVTRLGVGGALVTSTYIGGSDDDRGYRVALDGSGRAIVAGLTHSADFPLANAIQSGITGEGADAFVTQLDGGESTIGFSTYLGGSDEDAAMDVAAAPDGTVVMMGLTASSNFPTSGAVQGTIGGMFDAFVARVSTQPAVPPPVVEGVTALTGGGKPFRLKITGSNFQSGAEVFIGDDAEPWSGVKRKNDGQLVLKKGATLEARFPVGVAVPIRIVNPDGGRATATFTR